MVNLVKNTTYGATSFWIAEIYESPESKNWEKITKNIADILKGKKQDIESKIGGKIVSSNLISGGIPFVEVKIDNIATNFNNYQFLNNCILRVKPCVMQTGPQFSKLWFILEHHKENSDLSGNMVYDFFETAEAISKPVLEILKSAMEKALREDIGNDKFKNKTPSYKVKFKVAGAYSDSFNKLIEKSQSLNEIINLINDSEVSQEKEYYFDLQAFAYKNKNIDGIKEFLKIFESKNIQWRYRESKSRKDKNKEFEEEWKGYYAVFDDSKENTLELTGFVSGNGSEYIPRCVHNFPTAIVNESIDTL